MATRATYQADSIFPPRKFRAASGTPLVGTQTGVWVQAVDGTARPYNIALLPLGGRAATNPGQCDHIYISLQAQTNDIFFYFDNVSSSVLDDTAINAVGVALTGTTMAATMPYRLMAGTSIDLRIERSQDSWIVLKCAGAGTATLRLYASSQSEV